MKRSKKRPSPAMIVAMTALFISLVGTAFAGPIAEISGLSKKDKRVVRKITRKVSNRVSNRRITKRAPGLSVAAAQNANIANVANAANTANTAKNAENADDADKLGALPPSAYASSTAIRSVSAEPDGTVVASRSDGVSQSNVTSPETGVYCIDGLDPAPKTATVSIGFGGSLGAQIFARVNPGEIEVCSGEQIGVVAYNDEGTAAGQWFEMLIH